MTGWIFGACLAIVMAFGFGLVSDFQAPSAHEIQVRCVSHGGVQQLYNAGELVSLHKIVCKDGHVTGIRK